MLPSNDFMYKLLSAYETFSMQMRQNCLEPCCRPSTPDYLSDIIDNGTSDIWFTKRKVMPIHSHPVTIRRSSTQVLSRFVGENVQDKNYADRQVHTKILPYHTLQRDTVPSHTPHSIAVTFLSSGLLLIEFCWHLVENQESMSLPRTTDIFLEWPFWVFCGLSLALPDYIPQNYCFHERVYGLDYILYRREEDPDYEAQEENGADTRNSWI